MIFIQRVGTIGTVEFSGDMARVLGPDGQVVADWTTGGRIAGVPQGDGYTLEVMTAGAVQSEALAVGAVIFTLGQSNIERWFDSPTAVAAPAGTYAMSVDGKIAAPTGGAARHFADGYAAELGVPVLMVEGAVGGTALLAEFDKGNGYWLDTSPTSLYTNALGLLGKVGGSAELVLWAQGETDGVADVTTAQYASALTTMMDRILADFRPAGVLIQEVGPHGGESDSEEVRNDYDQVRIAQHQVAAALDGVEIGALTTDLNTVEDRIHLSGASRVLAADRMLDSALKLMGIDTSRELQTGSDDVAAGDSLVGTSGGDELRGLSGSDVLDGGSGSDVILGGRGDDDIKGGAGVDLLRGDSGNDVVDAGDDDDVISGGSGHDSLAGGGGNDEIWGDDGDDKITGGAGSDLIYGGVGTDTAVFAGKSTDYSIVVSGSRIVVRDLVSSDGDDGSDTMTGVEFLKFSDRTFDPNGPELPSLFTAENDVVDFATVRSGVNAGNSLYFGLDGDDAVYLPKDAAAAAVAGYDPGATFDAGGGADLVVGGTLDDRINGGEGNDVLSGSGGIDVLSGGAGDDVLDGGLGADRLEGGAGNDTYYVDDLGDVTVEKANEGIDTVYSSVAGKLTLKSNVENLILTGSGDSSGTGNVENNTITGNAGANTLSGGGGNDQLFGGDGADRLDGGDGNDVLSGGTGNDLLNGGAGNDVLDGSEGEADVAGYAGARSDYTVTYDVGTATFTVTDMRVGSLDGTDTVTGVERFVFNKVNYTAADLANVIDTAAPGAPSGLALGSDSDTGVAGDLRTADVTPTLTGTAEAGATVRLYDTDGTTLLGTTTADGSGSWSVTSASLAEGDHSLTLRTTDAAGNTSGPSASLVVTIDTTAAAPGVALVNDTGSSSTDGITGDGRVAVSGLESGARWEYSTNSGGSWASGSGTGFTLAAGSYASGAIQVRQTDAAGNTSTAASLSQTQVLGAAVSVPTINPVAADDVISAAEQAAGVTITGSTDAGSSLALSIGGQARAATVAGTSWSYTLTAADYLAMGEGAETITATATDGTGNTSAAGSISLTIDTTAPGVPVILGLASGSDTGLAGDRVTTLATPAITGMAEAGATVVLYDSNGSSVLGSASAGNDGSWSITSLPLSLGDHALTVRVTDAAGNLSGPSSALTLNIAASDLPVINITSSEGSTQAVISLYQGPVAYLQYEFLGGRGGEIVAATAGNDFLNLLGGDDAANGGAGNDVLDGGTGSNFLTGGAGQDVFFLDGRSGQTTWSTITDWTAGEQLSVWGWRPGVSQVTWAESAGAEGYKGVTMHADLDANGVIDTSVTWAGMTQAQLPTPVQFDGLLWFT
jgi:Ca2+-binding RTX toxin-like protein